MSLPGLITLGLVGGGGGGVPVAGSVSLSVADNGDGTGGVATVSGGDAGATNNLYAAPFGTGANSWSLVGTRSGNGTIAIASPGDLALGYYLFRVDSLTDGGYAVGTVFGSLSNSGDSLFKRILDAVEYRVQALNLAGTQVLEKWLPRLWESVDTTPTIVICPAPVSEVFLPGLTTQDDIGLLVLVAIIDAQNQDFTANLSRNTLWRERIISAFRWQRLPGVTEVVNCIPLDGKVIDPGAFDKNYFESHMVFNFVTRTQRG